MHSRLVLTSFLLLGVLLLAAGEGRGESASSAFEAAVRARVEVEPEETAEALLRFYEARDFQPAWFSQGQVRAAAHQFLVALCEVEEEGLRPERYHRSELAASLSRPGAEAWPEDAWVPVELRLTSSFLSFASHLLSGQVSPKRFRWRTQPPERDLAAVLEEALASGDVAESLRGLSPPHEGFRQLKEVLARYRAIAAAGGWPLVPPGELLERGGRGPRVAVLRERLRISGDLPPAPEERRLYVGTTGLELALVQEGLLHRAVEEAPLPPLPPAEDVFDEALEEAVKRFQRRHGLTVDGLVGPRTLAALRVPVEERIQQVLVNLERWRWVPRELGGRHVVVNLPAFELEAVDGSHPALRMRVIVGTQRLGTPIFQDEVEYLVLHPVWYLPEGISRWEVLPQLQEDPGAAERLGLTVRSRSSGEVVDPWEVDWSSLDGEALPYRFEQAPGPANPLGRVKFIFPNHFAVYLHDTPHPELFEEEHRAFSHGCIRVEEPVKLAAFMLRGHDGWTEEALAAAMKAGGEPR
ncbi:MAG TPA: L,D-transpeptidase family protein, partial [Myxococcaceae bacterium]|nr:L,D-transpeptidase family protein [Myxococcaceae bacterium]